jgi:hypothetical protein
MLERISDGRTDLVFDHLSAGYPADSTDAHGVSLIKWCAYHGDVSAIRHLLAGGETTGVAGGELRPQRRGLSRPLATLPVPCRAWR